MRKFNPEKELSKIRNGNKNKIIVGLCALLLVVVVGYSFALYQVRHTNKLVFNTVGEFKKRDIYLSVLVDGETKSEFPGKDDGYVFDNIQCDKPGIEASFNNDTWKLTLTTGTTNKCTVKFITKPYIDESGANYPDLFQGLIPIRYDNNKIYVADYKEKWYDYNNHEWANAVLIDHDNPEVMEKFYTDGKLNVNTEITTDDILQMYVWIPRYKYQLFNVNNEGKPKQLINIKFENTIETTGDITCKYINNMDGTIKEECLDQNQEPVENGDWYTHPAFTFKGTLEENGTELRGIWVGKFEPSDPTDENGRTNGNQIKEITVLPDKTSMINRSISTAFFVEQKLNNEKNKYDLDPNEVDTRIMKNIEWGAVAYLTSSKYGIYSSDGQSCMIDGMTKELCEVWINNTAQGVATTGVTNTYGGTHTGCVGDSVSAAIKWNTADDGSPAKCDDDKKWNTVNGRKASTTGNIYGIYDMSGGAWEYMMGVIKTQEGTDIYYVGSGFNETNMPEAKYYDLYEFSESNITHKRGHLGDSTRETLLTFRDTTGGWNADYTRFPAVGGGSMTPWFSRGGFYFDATSAGILAFRWAGGNSDPGSSFRSVLSAA